MTESAYSSIHGAEISERSAELVLPSSPAASPRAESVDPSDVAREAAGGSWRTAPLVASAGPSDAVAIGAVDPGLDGARSASAAQADPSSGLLPSPSDSAATSPADTSWSAPRGQPLPGDRGPRESEGGSQRPSFWRRIALGRRAQTQRSQFEGREDENDAVTVSAQGSTRESGGDVAIGKALAARRALSTRDANDSALARANESVERRIVEPLLQALVSVEAKLERSHVDLVGRSDQVEQRLTQLWDIEEQLGALGELQETVLQVTEQQRRLESALVAQTRILRWLVGGIILSLAVAAFAVAFFLRVAS